MRFFIMSWSNTVESGIVWTRGCELGYPCVYRDALSIAKRHNPFTVTCFTITTYGLWPIEIV